MNLSNQSNKELLILQASAINELKHREVVSTNENPLGDYTGWLVSRGLNLELSDNMKDGYDAISPKGVKVQIKGRRVTKESKSRHLGAIENYTDKEFDRLVAIIFDEDFEILDAVLIPHNIINEYAKYRVHSRAYFLNLRGKILVDERVICIKKFLNRI